jgi:hypothetical protein
MGRFAPPSKKVQVDVALDEIVLRTLEREPERRYQHAVEVKTDVESIGACRPPAALAPPALAPAPRAAAPRLSRLAVGAVLASLGGPIAMALLLLALRIALRSDPRSPTEVHAGAPIVVRSAVVVGRLALVAFALLSTLGMAVGCGLGWAALARIRREWPRWYGVGAATIGLWVLPLLALDTLLTILVYVASKALHVNRGLPLVLFSWIVLLLAANVLWIVHRRRRFLTLVQVPAPRPG